MVRGQRPFRIFATVPIFAFVSVLVACEEKVPQSSEKSRENVTTVRQAEKSEPASVLINSAPLFESQADWSSGYLKAIGHGAGVVVGPGVDNPNVFAQRFPARAGEQFKVIARASSVKQAKSMGRIQINWVDENGKFLSVASDAFEVSAEEKKFEVTITAPPGVASGTIYVVPNGVEHVVRYTEMRLLGEGTGKNK